MVAVSRATGQMSFDSPPVQAGICLNSTQEHASVHIGRDFIAGEVVQRLHHIFQESVNVSCTVIGER